MKGRKPKPSTAAADRAIAPAAPDHLSDDERAEFDAVARHLAAKRVVSVEDAHALEVFAVAMVRLRLARKMIDEQGAVVAGAKGPVKNPWCVVEAHCWDRVKVLLVAFGMTPADRGRAKATTPTKPAADFFAPLRVAQ